MDGKQKMIEAMRRGILPRDTYADMARSTYAPNRPYVPGKSQRAAEDNSMNALNIYSVQGAFDEDMGDDRYTLGYTDGHEGAEAAEDYVFTGYRRDGREFSPNGRLMEDATYGAEDQYSPMTPRNKRAAAELRRQTRPIPSR